MKKIKATKIPKATKTSPWRDWVEYFRRNLSRRPSIDWDVPGQVDPRLRRELVRSVQRFQVGETGEGRHLRLAAAREADGDYQEALDRFIKEEQEHARLLARLLERLDADPLRRHWSDLCFMLLRRLSGLRLELVVLLTAEMIGKRYYQALHAGLSDPVFRSVCAQILEDEEGHLAFHIAYLGRAFYSLSLAERVVLRAGWRMFFRLACLVVLWDHRGLLAGLGVSGAMFWWDTGLIFDRVASDILRFPSERPAPVWAKTVGLGPSSH